MKIRIVHDFNTGFHPKLLDKTTTSILAAGHEIVNEWDNDTLPVTDHYVRVVSWKKWLKDIQPDRMNSCLSMGLALVHRDEEERAAFEEAIECEWVHKIVVMSNDPQSLRSLYPSDKLVITDEPPYETLNYYRQVSRTEARVELGIPLDKRMILYFGTYFFSKGADILLNAAKYIISAHFYMVGDTGITSFTHDIKADTPLNVHWVDKYVDETTARNYFRACNAIVLPYRHYYTHDTSGILNQAMLAQRPVIVPDIPPFKNVIDKYDVGNTFKCEDMVSLAEAILNVNAIGVRGYDEYLGNQIGWDIIGKSL
jgi:glycosyltransferase involved in cell wall biosynthesis